MKKTTIAALVLFVVVGLTYRTPELPTPKKPAKSQSTLGGIRDGMAALTKFNEEIEAARRTGYIDARIQLPTKLEVHSAYENKECPTCQGCVPESKPSTETDCAACSQAQPEQSRISTEQSGTRWVPRRKLFRRWR